jgi:hypothetical protein
MRHELDEQALTQLFFDVLRIFGNAVISANGTDGAFAIIERTWGRSPRARKQEHSGEVGRVPLLSSRSRTRVQNTEEVGR